MEIFGWQHFVYLAVVFIVAVPALICAKKFAKTEKSQKIIIKSIGLALLISILASRITLTCCSSTPQWHKMFPNQFCGTSSLVLSLAVLLGKKDNNVLHFVWFLSLLGGVITLIYPDFLPQNPSIFYGPTITGLLHHTIAIIMVIVLLMFNQIHITYKKWYCTLFGFATYFAYGAFLISVLGYGDAFHMFTPFLPGTPFTAWVLAPIYIVIYGLIVLDVELFRRRKQKKADTQNQPTGK